MHLKNHTSGPSTPRQGGIHDFFRSLLKPRALPAQAKVTPSRPRPKFGQRAKVVSKPVSRDKLDQRPDPIDPFVRNRKSFHRRVIGLPKKGVLRILFTAAQDATPVHEGFWPNLERYLDWCKANSGGAGAELIVSGFPYNKPMFSAANEKTDHLFLDAATLHEMSEKDLRKTVFFDSSIEPYYSERHIEVAGLVDLCAEINILPTAVTPLSGYHSYTNGRWGIFPHVKHQLESIARMPGKPYKANVTTGACTAPNYIARSAGQKAEMHHTIGFVIVEVLPDGRFWVRMVSADPETGAFHDLDRYVDDQGVHEGRTVETISYGDIHCEKLDPEVAKATWGYCIDRRQTMSSWSRNSLLERLRPEHQFMHDASDFSARNHHNIDDPDFIAETYFTKQDSVEDGLRQVSYLLASTSRPWCTTVVVQSNHDNAFLRWTKFADVRRDPENSELFHRANAEKMKHLRETGTHLPIFEVTVRKLAPKPLSSVVFIDEDDSYEVNSVEHSQHGHIGPNGSRGSALGLSKVAPKMTIGHGHGPIIRDGLFMSGCCNLKQGYNKGASGWAIAHTIGHYDGTRQILFFDGGDFHAPAV